MAHVPTPAQRAARVAEQAAASLLVAKNVERKVEWLKSLSDRGFTFTRVFGVHPFKKVELDGEKQLQCLCKTGSAGGKCGRPGKHATSSNPVKNSGYIENYSHDNAKKMKYANWGVLTGKILPDGSRVLVIDVDVFKGGKESLEECIQRLGELPSTFKVKTGTGGYHLYFRYDGSRHIQSRNNHQNLGKGLDVKAHGGFVIAPGCLHKCGGWYEVHEESSIDAEIAFLPDLWLDELETVRKQQQEQEIPQELQEAMIKKHREAVDNGDMHPWAQAALDQECEAIFSAPSGKGNQTQNDSSFNIGQIVGAGLLNYHDAFAALLDAANSRSGGSSGETARKTVTSGLTSGMLSPRFPKENELKGWQPDEFEDFGPYLEAYEQEMKQKQEKKREAKQQAKLEKRKIAEATNSLSGIVTDTDADTDDADEADDSPIITRKIRRSASSQLDLELRQLAITKKGISSPSPANDDFNTHDHSNNKHHQQPPATIPWNRCKTCVSHRRHCAKCADRLGCTVPHPGNNICPRPVKRLLQSTLPGMQHKFLHLKKKCGCAHCTVCRADYEFDHLSHAAVWKDGLNDHVSNPQVYLPKYDVEDITTTPVSVQPHCFRVEMDEKYRARYSNKLSKRKILYQSDLVFNEMVVFYIFLRPGEKQRWLNYSPAGTNLTFTPSLITFAEHDKQSRENLSNVVHGYIKLSKSDWEMATSLDEGTKARERYKFRTYCRQLAMPKRMVGKGHWKGVAISLLDSAQLRKIVEDFFGEYRERGIYQIDKSYKRGLTQCLLEVGLITLPENISEAKIKQFVLRWSGKDRCIVPVSTPPESTVGASATTGYMSQKGIDSLYSLFNT